jgi:hypothetical protein
VDAGLAIGSSDRGACDALAARRANEAAAVVRSAIGGAVCVSPRS